MSFEPARAIGGGTERAQVADAGRERTTALADSSPELQRCIRDLLGILALPSLTAGRDPQGVFELLFEALEAVMPLDLAYGVAERRITGGDRVEVLRVGRRDAVSRLPELRETLTEVITHHHGGPQRSVDGVLGTWRSVVVPIGFHGQDGALLFASHEASFPDPSHTVLIHAASSLTAAALNTSRLVRESEAASRAKDEFLAMLGHELRNPLAPIVTALQLYKTRNSASSRELEIIERQVGRLVTLVDDMMDISRITRGKVELKKEPLELGTIVHGAIEAVQPMLTQRSHTLEVEAPKSGLVVEGDAMRLTQVVTNLLTNAAKYTDPGGRIEVRAKRVDDHAVLTVADNGMGIGADLLPRIFELFVQGRPTIHRREGGLGIGLALVKNLVQLHGGSVCATSEGPDRGSVFEVRLPLGRPMAARTVGHRQQQAEQGDTPAETILVVDDNVDAANLLAELLRDVGHHVTVVHDGEQALRVMQATRPSVAILDIGLPGLDGYEVAAKARAALGSATPRLVALTGYGQARDRARSERAGFAVHLVKPVNVAAVLAAVSADVRPKAR